MAVKKPAKKAATKATKQPVKAAVKKPVVKAAAKAPAKPAAKATAKPVAKPAAKKPVAKPAAKPAAKKVVAKPAAKPVAKKPVAKPAAKPVPAPKPAPKPEAKAAPAKAVPAKAPAAKTAAAKSPASKPPAKVEAKASSKPTPVPTPNPTPAPPPTPQPKPKPPAPPKPPVPGPRPNPNEPQVPKGVVKAAVAAPRPTVGKVAVAVISRQAAPAPKTQVKVIPYKTDEATGRPILPAGYKPSVDEEYMSTLQLEYFRQRLLGWRADLIEESKQTIENLKDEVRDVGDDAERATRETENSLELRTRDRYRKLIGKIDSTLKRLEAGEYGYSVDSGEEIGLHRLEARLTAERTIDEQERWEHLQKQQGD